jgi:hypothetical protein
MVDTTIPYSQESIKQIRRWRYHRGYNRRRYSNCTGWYSDWVFHLIYDDSKAVYKPVWRKTKSAV